MTGQSILLQSYKKIGQFSYKLKIKGLINMGLFRRSTVDKPPSDGPKEWARKAREINEQVKAERESTTDTHSELGTIAVGHENILTKYASQLSVESLEEIARTQSVPKGKYIRIGELVIVAPLIDDRRGLITEHRELHSEFAKEDGESKVMLEAAQNTARERGDVIEVFGRPNPHAVEDAGAFEIKLKDGHLVRLDIGGTSGAYKDTSPSSRQQTLELVSKLLGPEIIVQESYVKPY
jgi:hypothetical protein